MRRWHTEFICSFSKIDEFAQWKLTGFNTFSRVCFYKERKQNQFVRERWAENIVNFLISKLDNKQNLKTMPNFSSDKVYLIYASIVENLLKILFGCCSLVWTSSYDIENYSMRSELCNFVLFFCFLNQFTANHSFYALIIIGLTGIFLSLRYIAKIKDGLIQKNILWNRFQWLALFYQVVFSYCFFSVHTARYDRFQMVVFLYSLLDIFGMFSIFAILSTIQSSNDNDDILAADSSMDPDFRTISAQLLIDSPPSYDDVVKHKIGMVWYSQTLNRDKLVWAIIMYQTQKRCREKY